jgi:membrane peptidoglycan carboxypeptidase
MPIKYFSPNRKLRNFTAVDSGPVKKSKLSKKKVFAILGILFAAGTLLCAVGLFLLTKDLPDPNRLIDREVAQSTKIYDRTGQTVLYEISGNKKRTLINVNEIPDYIKWATIAIEDKDFYNHSGFSIMAIARTAITNVIFHKKAGASTLTQQFIKNAVLSSEKTYTRKIKEAILAYQVEKKFNKDQILQMYLNEIPYGSTAYGIQAAAQKYFSKDAKDLNLAEATILTSLAQAPSRYSPYGPNKDLLIARQHYNLDLMVEQGYISKEQAESAKNTKIEFKQQDNAITAPHFVMYVKELIADKYGEKMVEQGGLKIYTTLDLYKQRIAEESIKEKVEKNIQSFNAWNSSLVSIDPKTGQILAMVGSKDYFGKSEPEECTSGKTCKFEPNDNVSLRPRQPGSSIKPIVYATAFMKGYTPQTILYDVVTNFSNDKENEYIPLNYNLNEYGPVTMKKALAGSLNIPAVKTLYLGGIDNVLNLARDLGYSTLKNGDRYGLTLVLGGGEVELLEHTNAYSSFARDGLVSPTTPILKIEDKDGNVLEEYKEGSRKAMDSSVARAINSILTDNTARSFIFGSSNHLTLGNRPVGAKTGTTNDNRDAWCIGYTPSIVTGVWVGNNDNSPMKKGADGSIVAAPVWHDYMKRVLGDTPIENFREYAQEHAGKPVLDGNISGETKVKIDKASGFLATDLTPKDYVVEKTYKQHHSILYYVDKDDPRGNYPKSPQDDPQFSLWEGAVAEWSQKRGEASSTPPSEYDNIHTQENLPALSISSPADGEAVKDPYLNVSVLASASRGINRAEYYFNDILSETVTTEPFGLYKDISFLGNGYHNLKVKVCDDVDNCAEKNLSINLSLENSGAAQTSFNWIEPSNGLSVYDFDFPINLKLQIQNFKNIQQLEIYYQPTNSPNSALITKFGQLSEEFVVAGWVSPPPSGTYNIYAISLNWGGQSKKSKNVLITVNNSK